MGTLMETIALVTAQDQDRRETAMLGWRRTAATVVLAGRRFEPLREVASLIEKANGKALVRSLDIESRASIFEYREVDQGCIGAVDILVNNAGSASKVLNARFLSEESGNST